MWLNTILHLSDMQVSLLTFWLQQSIVLLDSISFFVLLFLWAVGALFPYLTDCFHLSSHLYVIFFLVSGSMSKVIQAFSIWLDVKFLILPYYTWQTFKKNPCINQNVLVRATYGGFFSVSSDRALLYFGT